MIESIEFTNFKALRKTTLPLAPLTLLLGPNGSGKSSVLQALRGVAAVTPQGISLHQQSQMTWSSLLSVTENDRTAAVEVKVRLRLGERIAIATFRWHSDEKPPYQEFNFDDETVLDKPDRLRVQLWLSRMHTFALDANVIAEPVAVNFGPLQTHGLGLAAVLVDLQENHPDRVDLLKAEMRLLLPEYDHILFDTPKDGHKAVALRTKKGGHRIPARELSQGTLISLALLTLAHLPEPPSVIGLEEIDRGLHPRLLRHLQDALYRLAYPESCGELRPPIQVIATTHSPYLLDIFRDHPEEVVLADKEGLEVQMKRLSDIEHYEDIIGDSTLSEVWYSGVLGGV